MEIISPRDYIVISSPQFLLQAATDPEHLTNRLVPPSGDLQIWKESVLSNVGRVAA
jgi:hypothetical protein